MRDGRLVLHSTQRLWIPHWHDRLLQDHVGNEKGVGKSYGFQTCRHDPSRDSSMSKIWPWFPGASVDLRVTRDRWMIRDRRSSMAEKIWKAIRRPAKPYANVTSKRGEWCPFCPTTHYVWVYDHGKRGTEVVLEVHQSLGEYKTADYTEWSFCWLPRCKGSITHKCSLTTLWPELETWEALRKNQWLMDGSPHDCLRAGRSGVDHPSAEKALEYWYKVVRKGK